MEKGLIAKVSTEIAVPAEKLWEGLTKPELIKQYFFGTEAISEWKVGSSIVFKGEWEGKPYEDKGVILELIPNQFLRYNYWSSVGGTPDLPENYAEITYSLTENNNSTTLTITQDSIPNEEKKKQSEDNWNYLLNSLKDLLEKAYA